MAVTKKIEIDGNQEVARAHGRAARAGHLLVEGAGTEIGFPGF
jgi:hypothetical protein